MLEENKLINNCSRIGILSYEKKLKNKQIKGNNFQFHREAPIIGLREKIVERRKQDEKNKALMAERWPMYPPFIFQGAVNARPCGHH